MANKEHLKILKKGVKIWNHWRAKNRAITPDLRGADLQSRDLLMANLSEAVLSGANLSASQLDAADLRSADLREAKFVNACLNSAYLSDADLTKASLVAATLCATRLDRAKLVGADLRVAEFYHAEVNETDFHSSKMGGTIIAKMDLSSARGLESIRHDSPSSIATDTLYASKGKICDLFLRGAGLSDELIQFARSLSLNAIEFNSCFISYSTKDQGFTERLYADLQANGVRCWFAPHDIKGGRKLQEQIDDAIHFHEKVLLILSPDSIHSNWVKTEIAKTRKREVAEKRQMLFPLRLMDFGSFLNWEYFDADTGTDYAKEIRSYFIPDFSNWKNHDSYQKAFTKLLADLRKGEKTKAAPA